MVMTRGESHVMGGDYCYAIVSAGHRHGGQGPPAMVECGYGHVMGGDYR